MYQLLKHDDFLIEKMKRDWDKIQKEAKREEIIRKTKEAGIFMAKTILTLAAISGVLVVAVVAPNIFSAFGRGSRGRRGFFDRDNFNQGVKYLNNQNQISVKKLLPDKFEIRLTDTGRGVILKSSYDRLKINPPKSWDGQWRIVAFDIPNKHKVARDGFRKKLKELGFYQWQKSLFIIPFECEAELRFVVSVYSAAPYLKFIKTSYISNEEELKKYFGLI